MYIYIYGYSHLQVLSWLYPTCRYFLGVDPTSVVIQFVNHGCFELTLRGLKVGYTPRMVISIGTMMISHWVLEYFIFRQIRMLLNCVQGASVSYELVCACSHLKIVLGEGKQHPWTLNICALSFAAPE